MSSTTVMAIVRHEMRVLRGDVMALVMLAVIPIVLAAFFKPMLAAVSAQGGAAAAVPGMTVMFSLVLTSNVGYSFFLEHRWNTWERLRCEAVTPAEIVVGKAFPWMVFVTVYQLAVLGVGGAFLGLRVRGAIPLLVPVVVCFAFMVVTLGFALVAVCRSGRQMTAYSQLATLFFGGLAGALTPLALLPGWAQAVAPFTPAYWAISAMRAVALDSDAVSRTARAAVVLVLFGAGFLALGLSRFNVSDRKTYIS